MPSLLCIVCPGNLLELETVGNDALIGDECQATFSCSLIRVCFRWSNYLGVNKSKWCLIGYSNLRDRRGFLTGGWQYCLLNQHGDEFCVCER
jgi:hypothetical protein